MFAFWSACLSGPSLVAGVSRCRRPQRIELSRILRVGRIGGLLESFSRFFSPRLLDAEGQRRGAVSSPRRSRIPRPRAELDQIPSDLPTCHALGTPGAVRRFSDASACAGRSRRIDRVPARGGGYGTFGTTIAQRLCALRVQDRNGKNLEKGPREATDPAQRRKMRGGARCAAGATGQREEPATRLGPLRQSDQRGDIRRRVGGWIAFNVRYKPSCHPTRSPPRTDEALAEYLTSHRSQGEPATGAPRGSRGPMGCEGSPLERSMRCWDARRDRRRTEGVHREHVHHRTRGPAITAEFWRACSSGSRSLRRRRRNDSWCLDSRDMCGSGECSVQA